jgi:predicted nucleotidyltransferase component of viral defense system
MTRSTSSSPLDVRRLIQQATRASGVPQYVIEKDFALSYVLAGISAIPELQRTLIFKGGTCLRKMYFSSYRFSEDLDFSYASNEPARGVIPSALPSAIEKTRSLLQEQGPFVIDLAPARHQSDHPTGQLEYQIRVQFPWMRTPDCAVKLEITTDEPVLMPAVQLSIQHAFSESVAGTLKSYTLEEIVAEKLRALLQKRQQLDDRGWMSNRARDVYDLAFLKDQSERPIDWSQVSTMLLAKAASRNVSFSAGADFLDQRVVEFLRRDWRSLELIMKNVPSFDACIASVQWIIRSVVDEE